MILSNKKSTEPGRESESEDERERIRDEENENEWQIQRDTLCIIYTY